MRIEDEPVAALLLTESDKLSSVWIKVSAHLDDQLRIARIKNDNEKLTEIQTAIIRGRIQTLKSIQALGNASPVISD